MCSVILVSESRYASFSAIVATVFGLLPRAFSQSSTAMLWSMSESDNINTFPFLMEVAVSRLKVIYRIYFCNHFDLRKWRFLIYGFHYARLKLSVEPVAPVVTVICYTISRPVACHNLQIILALMAAGRSTLCIASSRPMKISKYRAMLYTQKII